jgi:hypothetical protein
MVMVRFATKCDRCGKRSEEYTSWPSCRECLNDTCPDCTHPGTLQEHDYDRESEDGTFAVHTEDVICKDPDCVEIYKDEIAHEVKEMAAGR